MRVNLLKIFLLAVLGVLLPHSLQASVYPWNGLYGETVYYPKGYDATLKINIENVDPLEGFQFDMALPEGMEVATVNGKLDISFLPERVDGTSFTLSSRYLANKGVYRIVAVSLTGDTFNEVAAPMLSIKLTGDPELGLHMITYTNIELTENQVAVKVEETISEVLVYARPESISIDPASLELYLTEGCSVPQVTVTPAEATEYTEIEWISMDEAVATVADGRIEAVGVGETSIVAHAHDIYNKEGVYGEAVAQLTVKPIAESIAIDQEAAVLAPGETAELKATIEPSTVGDLEVAWTSSDEAVATVDGGVVTAVGAGTAEIVASCWRVGDEYISSEPCAITVKNHQKIDFALENIYTVGDVVELAATATSGLPVTYILTEGADLATLDGNSITLRLPGSVTVEARQEGNDLWFAAELVSLTFDVVKKPQTITWECETTQYYVGEPVALAATTDQGLEVAFEIVEGADIAEIIDGNLMSKAAGTVVVAATQGGNATVAAAETVKKTFTFVQREQTIDFTLPSTMFVTETIELAATATSGLDVEYEIIEGMHLAQINGNVLEAYFSGTVTVKATQPGNAEWAAAEPVTATIELCKRQQEITFDLVPEILGGKEVELKATATSGLPVSFAIVEGSDLAVIEDGVFKALLPGQVTVRASQTGTNEWEEAPDVDRTILIYRLDQWITWDEQNTELYVGESVELTAQSKYPELKVEYAIIAGADCAELADGKLIAKKAGEVTVEATQPGTISINPADPVQSIFVIKQREQEITLNPYANYGVRVFSTLELEATASSELPVEFALVDGGDYASLDGNVLTGKLPGTVTIEATQPGNLEWAAAEPVRFEIIVNKAVQYVEWSGQECDLYVGESVRLTAEATSGLEVVYVVSSISAGEENMVEIEGDVLTAKKAGKVTINATQPGNEYYEPALPEGVCTFLIKQREQEIDLHASAFVVTVGESVEFTATATSGLEVELAIIEGSEFASIEGNVLTAKLPGVVIVEATQPGNDEWAAAQPVTISISIDKKNQEILWNQAVTQCYVGETIELTAESTEGLEIEYRIVGGKEFAELDGNVLRALAEGVIEVEAKQAGNETVNKAEPVYKSFTFERREQEITFQLPSSMVVGESIELNATSTSGLAVIFKVVEGEDLVDFDGSVLVAKLPGSVTIEATQEGNDEWNAADPVAVGIGINKKSQEITWDQTETELYVGESLKLTAESSEGLDIVYTIIDGADLATIADGSITGVKAGIVLVEASQPGTDQVAEAQPVVVTFEVKQRTQEIVWEQEVTKVEVGKSLVLTATSTSGLTVTYEIVDGADLAEIEGSVFNAIAEGTVVVRAMQVGNDEWEAATPVEMTFTVKPLSGIAAITVEAGEVKVVDGAIIVGNAGTLVEVFAPNGALLYRGCDSRIELGIKGLCIVKIGNAVTKVVVK